MTPAQEDAIARIKEIAREHFEASAFVFQGEIDDERDDIRVHYHGGCASAYGLLGIGQKQLWRHEIAGDSEE